MPRFRRRWSQSTTCLPLPRAGSGVWKITPRLAEPLRPGGESGIGSKSVSHDAGAHAPSPPLTGSGLFFFSPFSILISKLSYHLTLMGPLSEAVHHVNGSVYRCEHSPCTMICNLLSQPVARSQFTSSSIYKLTEVPSVRTKINAYL